MRRLLGLMLSLAVVHGWSQGLPAPATDPLSSLHFLDGTWEAKAAGTNGISLVGTYTFAHELAGHVYARHGNAANCSGPKTFDCEHSDLLYVYPEGAGLKAIYFDNEGHTIHYDVTTPTPSSVVFLSDPGSPGPRFRLMYELKDGVMSGKFQMQPPGQAEWRSYLEWSGGKVR